MLDQEDDEGREGKKKKKEQGKEEIGRDGEGKGWEK